MFRFKGDFSIRPCEILLLYHTFKKTANHFDDSSIRLSHEVALYEFELNQPESPQCRIGLDLRSEPLPIPPSGRSLEPSWTG